MLFFFGRAVGVQGFPMLEAGCEAQHGSCGLWGGSHKVCGAYEASHMLFAAIDQ